MEAAMDMVAASRDSPSSPFVLGSLVVSHNEFQIHYPRLITAALIRLLQMNPRDRADSPGNGDAFRVHFQEEKAKFAAHIVGFATGSEHDSQERTVIDVS